MRTSRSFSSWSPWQRILKRPMTRLVDFFRSRWMAVDKNQTLRRQYLLFSRMVAVVAFVLNQRDSFASWLLCRSYCVPVRKACFSTHQFVLGRFWISSITCYYKTKTFDFFWPRGFVLFVCDVLNNLSFAWPRVDILRCLSTFCGTLLPPGVAFLH